VQYRFQRRLCQNEGRYIPLLRVEDLTGRSLKICCGPSGASICLGAANVSDLMQFCTIGEH